MVRMGPVDEANTVSVVGRLLCSFKAKPAAPASGSRAMTEGDHVVKGDWQRALPVASEITEAWLTDEDADLSKHIDAAIEKDAHDILYAMARLASAAIELHAQATGQDVRAVLRAASARALGE
jgi:hypothetical protein